MLNADYEMKKIITFINYEKSYGRQPEIICEDNNVLSAINKAAAHLDGTQKIMQIAKNEFVYHATDLKAAQKILTCGKLLSATRVYGKTGEKRT